MWQWCNTDIFQQGQITRISIGNYCNCVSWTKVGEQLVFWQMSEWHLIRDIYCPLVASDYLLVSRKSRFSWQMSLRQARDHFIPTWTYLDTAHKLHALFPVRAHTPEPVGHFESALLKQQQQQREKNVQKYKWRDQHSTRFKVSNNSQKRPRDLINVGRNKSLVK